MCLEAVRNSFGNYACFYSLGLQIGSVVYDGVAVTLVGLEIVLKPYEDKFIFRMGAIFSVDRRMCMCYVYVKTVAYCCPFLSFY